MDFLNKAYQHFSDLLRSMSPAARITTLLLLTIVIVSLVFLVRQPSSHAEEYLFGAEVLSQSEIAAVEAAFARADLNGWDSSGNRIRVPRGQKSKFMAAAAEGNAIPESLSNAWDKMLQQGSSFETRDIRELRARVTLEKDLALTLRTLRNVESAKVNIDESNMEGFPPRKRRRAMAAVKGLGNKVLEEEQVKTIRHTIAAGAGVAAEDVTVTDVNAGTVYPGVGKEGGATEFQNLYASYQRQYVQLYRQIITDALLPMYPGAKIAVNVELDKEILSQTTSFKYDDKPTTVSSSLTTKESSTTAGTSGGRPGAASNGVNSNTAAQVNPAQGAGESTTNESQENQKSLVGTQQTTTKKAPLSPVRITASIGIPTGHFIKIFQAHNVPAKGETAKTPTPDDLKQIETEIVKSIGDIVAPLLPRVTNGGDVFEPVKVVTFTETAVEPIPEPSLAATAGGWFAENWQTLGLFGLAGFGVVFLRGMIRAAQTNSLGDNSLPRTASTQATTAVADHGEEEESYAEADSATGSLKNRFQNSGRSLREELSDLVKENPDAAANVLKLWISDAA